MDGTRNIKDSLFVAIFNNPDAARELYNAVYGTRYGPETPVVMTTLDDVLYKGIKNDLSFIIGDIYMAMFEQQSTFNPNIPLRIVLYIAHVYEHIIPNKEMHKSTLLKIPRIQPAMFYLCKDPAKSAMKTNRTIMDLSKSFLGEPSELSGLELNVLVLNISPGFNKRLLQRSPRLRAYVAFFTQLWEHEKRMPRVQAVLAAVDWCVAHDMLADFFRQHRKEVSNMILNELTNDDAIEAAREETWEKARKEVREETWDEAQKNWAAAQKRMLALVKKGYTLEQAIQSEQLCPPASATSLPPVTKLSHTTKTKSSKR
jgi:hypothetical protein